MEKEFYYLRKNPNERLIILGDIFEVIARLDLTLISSVIDKQKYYSQYTDSDAEFRAWTYLFERCDMHISDISGGTVETGLLITDHHSSPQHDSRIKDYLRGIRLFGSGDQVKYHRFDHMIEEALFTPSTWRNLIQLADAVAYCSVQTLLNDAFFTKQFLTIQNKFRTSKAGEIKNYGFKVFPE